MEDINSQKTSYKLKIIKLFSAVNQQKKFIYGLHNEMLNFTKKL